MQDCEIVKALECCQTQYSKNCEECPYENLRKTYISVVTCKSEMLKDLLALIKRKQSEDTVKVVRCKDCKYYITPDRGWPYCELMSNPEEGEYYGPSDDHYCSYGERKKDNE